MDNACGGFELGQVSTDSVIGDCERRKFSSSSDTSESPHPKPQSRKPCNGQGVMRPERQKLAFRAQFYGYQ
jgi:hypothetical protein